MDRKKVDVAKMVQVGDLNAIEQVCCHKQMT
jgi:hypothetical protein